MIFPDNNQEKVDGIVTVTENSWILKREKFFNLAGSTTNHKLQTTNEYGLLAC